VNQLVSISVSYSMFSLSKGLYSRSYWRIGSRESIHMAPSKMADAEKIGSDFISKAGYKINFGNANNWALQQFMKSFWSPNFFGFQSQIDGIFLPKPLPKFSKLKSKLWFHSLLDGILRDTRMAFMQGQPLYSLAFISKVKQTYPAAFLDDGFSTSSALLLPRKWSDQLLDFGSDRFIAYSTWKWLDLHGQKILATRLSLFIQASIRPPLKGLPIWLQDWPAGTVGRCDQKC